MTDHQKTALVTGAFEGTGKHIAQTLAGVGYRVFGTSRSRRLNGVNGVDPLTLDLRDAASIEDCVQHVKDTAGRIDLLVNNAAITIVAPAEELPMPLVG